MPLSGAASLRRLGEATFRRRAAEAGLPPAGRAAADYYKQLMRVRIETAFSRLTATFPRHVQAASCRGFPLKVSSPDIAFALQKAFFRQPGLIKLLPGA